MANRISTMTVCVDCRNFLFLRTTTKNAHALNVFKNQNSVTLWKHRIFFHLFLLFCCSSTNTYANTTNFWHQPVSVHFKGLHLTFSFVRSFLIFFLVGSLEFFFFSFFFLLDFIYFWSCLPSFGLPWSLSYRDYLTTKKKLTRSFGWTSHNILRSGKINWNIRSAPYTKSTHMCFCWF